MEKVITQVGSKYKKNYAQHTFCAIANFVKAGRFSFARNIIFNRK